MTNKAKESSFIYVVLFDNGMVKVGKTKNPEKRIGQHADRVGCLGVSIDKTFVSDGFNGAGWANSKERSAIAWCIKNGGKRFGSEWFSGIVFSDLCDFVKDICSSNFTSEDVFVSDWHSIISMLCDFGYTQESIAKECNCSQPSISDLSKGRVTDPRYSIGKRLIELHDSVTRKMLIEEAKKAA